MRLISVIIVLFFFGLCSGQIKVKQIDTIVVHSSVVQNYKSIGVLKNDELQNKSGESLAHILENLSGISVITSGANNSKAAIQGLSNQRIAYINNGVKLESHQWGDDHMPEIDPYGAHDVKVIKGSESVRYGSNALGGVVVVNPVRLPYGGKRLQGDIQMMSASNSRKISGNLHLSGSVLKNRNLAWDFQMSSYKFGNYKTSDYYAANTGGDGFSTSGRIGYQMDREKVEFSWSDYYSILGMFQGARVGNPEDWNIRLSLGQPLNKGNFSYKVDAPRQDVRHSVINFTAQSNRKIGKFDFSYHYQENHRKEYDMRRGKFALKPSFDTYLRTHTLGLGYQKKHHGYFKNISGINLEKQENYNTPGNGVNSPIPNYIHREIGFFTTEEFRKKTWAVIGGLRYDEMFFSAEGYNQFGKYYSGTRNFSNMSYSIELEKQITKNLGASISVGHAWRAPEAIELYSNGVHHGSPFFVEGDSNLSLEKGLKWNAHLFYKRNAFSLSADVFHQNINDYIYQMPNGKYINTWSGYFPIFTYKQSNVRFRGLDLDIKYKITSNIGYCLSFSQVYAANLTEKYHIPLISPERLRHQLTYTLSDGLKFSKTFVSLSHQWSNKQKRFSPETDLIPFSPSAYNLFNMDMGTNWHFHKGMKIKVGFSVNNLLNSKYKEYTNRFRYFSHEPGRSFIFRLIYNF